MKRGQVGDKVTKRRDRTSSRSESLPRLVTVCIKGRPARHYDTYARRLKLLTDIVQKVDRSWGDLDAIVFPGGFLRLEKGIGPLSYAGRVKALNSAGLVEPIRKAVKRLRRSPGALIVFGIDGPSYPNEECGDQLCIAVNETGVVGIGRKIFPVQGYEANNLLCYDSDFGESHRVVKLPNGGKAILAACYDMFGFAERGDVNGTRSRNIRWVGTHGDKLKRGKDHFEDQLRRNLRSFKNLLTKDVIAGIAAIHGFSGSSTGFWQRHGIAACAAALKGGCAVGAAHFKSLPRRQSASTLAAAQVSTRHLKQGHRRAAHSWQPREHFFEESSALVRLFYP